MRTQTLKTYIKASIVNYYGKPLRFKTLLIDSKKDQRLADLSQAYFLSLNEQEKANNFSNFTNREYTTETFAESDQKYARQYRNQLKVIKEYNESARKRIAVVMKNRNFTKYKVAKELGVNQSNLTEFFEKKKDTKLDADRVFKTFGFED